MTRTPRIRCNYCNRRIPASSVICPNCHRNPRAFYWRTRYTIIAAILSLLVLGGLAILAVNTLGTPAPQSAALSATATATETRAPMTVIVVATRAPATGTAVSSKTEVTRPLPTETNSPTAPRSNTPALTVTPTSTRTRTPRVTSTRTRTATPIPITAPTLKSPPDEAKFGRSDQIVFDFSTPYTLRSDEWFRVQVDYLNETGSSASWCGFDKNPGVRLPKAVFSESSPYVRRFTWHVDIVRARATNTSDCGFPFEPLGAQSEIWAFNWY